ncbi:site-specific integrase [uncultured Rhodoblastus sp.]|uniref:site-specific integrase n=1 Tax=uncultured Rhodoblastus sp. TaxID=543037 RepID=UPI0025F889F0|nr:site-specific integrase [uncultured Rhodoblastus sp.]
MIKISLKTGDLPTAQRRWSDIHSQIEALVDAAVAGGKKPPEPVFDATPKLSTSDRATIASQARHDVMADHDADWTDPENLGPLARGLEQALRLRDSGQLPAGEPKKGDHRVLLSLADFSEMLKHFPPGMSLNEIREEARVKESASVKQMLSSGEAFPLDRPTTVVEEIELDSSSPAGGHVVDTFEVLGELTARLKENGFELLDETERRKVAHAVLTAKAAAFQDIERRKQGLAIETPLRPAPLIADGQAGNIPTILEMHDIWAERIKPDRKTKDDNKLYVERFVSMHGNLRVDQIRRKHAREFRDQLKKFPAAMPALISNKPFLQIVEWAEKNNPPRLSPYTVNMKGLGALSLLMRLAVNEFDFPGGDPTSGLRLPVSDSDVLERHPFTPPLLAKMAMSPVFQEPPKVSIGGCGAAAFWIPLVSLYSGARLEEVGQLLLSDIFCESGIPYFWFREDDEESETNKKTRRRGKAKSEEDKSIKTKAGRRRVPVHGVLIELGLLEYIEARRKAGDKMLFPGLTSYRGRWTKNWSRWWARYQDEHITDDPAFVFHSFRHSFIGAMRRINMQRDLMKVLVGHARELEHDQRGGDDVTESYGDAVPIKVLNRAMQRINYPGLKFKRIEAFLS